MINPPTPDAATRIDISRRTTSIWQNDEPSRKMIRSARLTADDDICGGPVHVTHPRSGAMFTAARALLDGKRQY